jgi:phosphoribosylaminoimidazole-succinocarboxamide synthase
VSVLLETNLPNVYARGKVRDSYDLGDGRLLIVATDRLSAFDVVMRQGVPDKGAVLTQLSAFWFERMANVMPNHFLRLIGNCDNADLPFPCPHVVSGRSMIVKKAKRIDIECVARGYLSGSGWTEYRQTGAICGVSLPKGLRESDELPEAVFTPSTKAATGHDMNIGFAEVADIVGTETAKQLREATLAIYRAAADYAIQRGIIIADTKMEFGWHDGKVMLIDELLTPDSSRFWEASTYEPGKSQASFDKQPVRDWLVASGWNREPPPPDLPDDVVAGTSERYREAFRRLTGHELILSRGSEECT